MNKATLRMLSSQIRISPEYLVTYNRILVRLVENTSSAILIQMVMNLTHFNIQQGKMDLGDYLVIRQEYISERTGLSIRTIQRCSKMLADMGYLDCKKNKGHQWKIKLTDLFYKKLEKIELSELLTNHGKKSV